MGLFDKDEDIDDEVILDGLEEAPEPEPEPTPAPKPVLDPELTPRPANSYVLKRGDHPSSVAVEIYGSVSYARELVLANPDSKWQAGDVISLL